MHVLNLRVNYPSQSPPTSSLPFPMKHMFMACTYHDHDPCELGVWLKWLGGGGGGGGGGCAIHPKTYQTDQPLLQVHTTVGVVTHNKHLRKTKAFARRRGN